MARLNPADLQRETVELRTDPELQRARDVAASVDTDEVLRLARSAPTDRSSGRRPVNVAIPDELYAKFEAVLGGLSKRAVVEQLIAGLVTKSSSANGASHGTKLPGQRP